MSESAAHHHWRTIFISDLHLGSRLCQADALGSFLKKHSCDHLYIVGDGVDIWALRSRSYFPDSHVNVVQKILKRAMHGTKVTWVIGNHDEALRDFLPMTLGTIELTNETIHVAANGEKYLVLHGDKFDQVMKYARWLVFLGDFAYTLLLESNLWINFIRKKFGLGYWSLSAYAKRKVKNAVNFIGDYETTVAESVKSIGVDGVICGHIHHPEIKYIDGVKYINTGDFCESLSAVVEDESGSMYLLRCNEKH